MLLSAITRCSAGLAGLKLVLSLTRAPLAPLLMPRTPHERLEEARLHLADTRAALAVSSSLQPSAAPGIWQGLPLLSTELIHCSRLPYWSGLGTTSHQLPLVHGPFCPQETLVHLLPPQIPSGVGVGGADALQRKKHMVTGFMDPFLLSLCEGRHSG